MHVQFIAHNGIGERHHIDDGEGCFTTTVEELNGVHTFCGNEQPNIFAVGDRVTEVNFGDRSTTISLGVIERTEFGNTLTL